MLITESLHEPFTWFVFKSNGTEAKVSFRDNKLTVLSGFLYSKTQEIAIRKIKELS